MATQFLSDRLRVEKVERERDELAAALRRAIPLSGRLAEAVRREEYAEQLSHTRTTDKEGKLGDQLRAELLVLDEKASAILREHDAAKDAEIAQLRQQNTELARDARHRERNLS